MNLILTQREKRGFIVEYAGGVLPFKILDGFNQKKFIFSQIK